jgi:cyclopropane fatty-acyl-phospholipid synthase-like methyltransferase
MEILTLDESITAAMEDFDINLIKYYPYLFQDYWSMGTPPEEIIKLIKKHKQNYSSLNVLDLGSGKGAVSIKIASEFKCKCFGIDGLKDFVIFSNNKAKEYFVENICSFEKNDIRSRIKTLGKYDIIILGAIGPVLGDFYQTLTLIKEHLSKDGIVIMNEGYVEDGHNTDYPNVFQKSIILNQIKNAGMEIIDSITGDEIPETKEYLENESNNLEKRCMELIEKYPEDKSLLLKYIGKQKELYDKLTGEVISVIFVMRNKV